MAYYTDLFTVETYEAFLASDRTISGFRETQKSMAERIKPGDKLLAYIKGLSCWSAVLTVLEGPFIERSPIFLQQDDPFIVRFRVNGSPILALDHSIPIRDEQVFKTLTFTRGREEGYWLGPLRRSLQHMEDADGVFLEKALTERAANPSPNILKQELIERFRPKQVKRADGTVGVTIPKDEPEGESTESTKAGRESIRHQAELARLGELMGFRIWLPRNDRSAVTQHWQPANGTLLTTLPLNYRPTA